MKDSRTVMCNNCGWGHFTVSKDYIKQWEAQWLKYFNEETPETLEMFGVTDNPPPPSSEVYYRCFCCGNSYKDFRDANDEDNKKLYGHTIQPILDYKEEKE